MALKKNTGEDDSHPRFCGGLCGGAKGPIKSTKDTFGDFVKWVEVNDRLPKKKQNARGDPVAKKRTIFSGLWLVGTRRI